MVEEVSRARYAYIHDKRCPPSNDKGHAFSEVVDLLGLGRRYDGSTMRTVARMKTSTRTTRWYMIAILVFLPLF
jgi:hypothetical protein